MTAMVNRSYVPPDISEPWQRIAPAEAGLEPDRLAQAVDFAKNHETAWPVDLRGFMEAGCFEPPPFNEIIGRVEPRGEPNGLVLRHGYIVASWGDTRRVDMAFSVAKSMLSLIAGIAFGDKLIENLDEPARLTIDDGGFDGAHNGAITWRHLLEQTSEWEGTLWGKSDVIDRNRSVNAEGQKQDQKKGEARPLQAPGTFWEYNDIRVNRLSLALLRRFRRNLPDILDERVMRPIGASSSWRWEGYRNSHVEIEGKRLISVPGGGHWGGGLFIHAEDLARVLLLMLRKGHWHGKELIPAKWIEQSLEPSALNPLYGLLWWLNTGRKKYPAASERSFFASGAGGNFCWIDPDKDIVAVLRWLDASQINAFIAKVNAALG